MAKRGVKEAPGIFHFRVFNCYILVSFNDGSHLKPSHDIISDAFMGGLIPPEH